MILDSQLAGRGEAGIVGEDAGLGVELADVDDFRTDRAVVEREIDQFLSPSVSLPVLVFAPVFASMIASSMSDGRSSALRGRWPEARRAACTGPAALA